MTIPKKIICWTIYCKFFGRPSPQSFLYNWSILIRTIFATKKKHLKAGGQSLLKIYDIPKQKKEETGEPGETGETGEIGEIGETRETGKTGKTREIG